MASKRKYTAYSLGVRRQCRNVHNNAYYSAQNQKAEIYAGHTADIYTSACACYYYFYGD